MTRVDLDEISFLGSGLHRPQEVLATANGNVFTTNSEGGVSMITAAGVHRPMLANGGSWLRPRGIALRLSGSFLIAHHGSDDGGVFEMSANGGLRELLVEVDGQRLPPTNAVVESASGLIWASVGTKRLPPSQSFRRYVNDGFIVAVDKDGPRVVAEDLGYPNHMQLNPTGDYLYVNETFGRRLTRFAVEEDGSLGPPRLVTEFSYGTFPDGLAFDEHGGIWVTSPISNRVIRVDPSGGQTLILEDVETQHLVAVEDAFDRGELGEPELETAVSARLRQISRICFGGPDLRTVYMGCMLGQSIATFRSPVAGAKPAHWEVAL